MTEQVKGPVPRSIPDFHSMRVIRASEELLLADISGATDKSRHPTIRDACFELISVHAFYQKGFRDRRSIRNRSIGVKVECHPRIAPYRPDRALHDFSGDVAHLPDVGFSRERLSSTVSRVRVDMVESSLLARSELRHPARVCTSTLWSRKPHPVRQSSRSNGMAMPFSGGAQRRPHRLGVRLNTPSLEQVCGRILLFAHAQSHVIVAVEMDPTTWIPATTIGWRIEGRTEASPHDVGHGEANTDKRYDD